MLVKVLEESGYEASLLGLSLSFYDHKEALDIWWSAEKLDRAKHRAKILAGRGGGHDKFLRSVTVQLYIQATRSFWSEFDTYGVGVTKNSSSTMHTLSKREVTYRDFSYGTSAAMVDEFNKCLRQFKDPESRHFKDITRLKDNLPEGWLQERQISTNYAALDNMLRQRKGHRLRYWSEFCSEVRTSLAHPELLTGV